MRFIHYAPVSFEKWDWGSPDDTGVGGSETAVAETARRLAERGHDVTVYAPLREGCPEVGPGGARWLPLESADFAADALWVLHRCPADVDRLRGQRAWVVCQDVEYAHCDGFAPERAEKLERVLALCPTQRDYYARQYPHLKGKLVVSSNGIRLDGIREAARVDCPQCHGHGRVDFDGLAPDSPNFGGADDRCPTCDGRQCGAVPRDPFKLVYFSSPDRGLINLLHVFRRAREFEPRLTLAVAYGLDNLRKCVGPYWRQVEREVESLVKQPGVTWLGRLPQPALWGELFTAGLWCYPTDFTETSCIACMEAQACGCVPVVSPPWALGDNVGHGVVIGGPAGDPLTRARFARELVQLAWDHGLQEKIRAEMMPWARDRFGWDRVVDDWEGWALGHTDCASWSAQYAFQLRHARGKVLNVGCNCDMPGFGRRGGVNVDLLPTDPYTGVANAAHVLADARRPLPFAAEFDTAILGDVLEHLNDADATACLRNAAACLRPGGRLLLTVPEDHRPEDSPVSYAPGIPGGHPRPVTADTLAGWLAAAGLRAELEQRIDYGHFTGRGVVACA